MTPYGLSGPGSALGLSTHDLGPAEIRADRMAADGISLAIGRAPMATEQGYRGQTSERRLLGGNRSYDNDLEGLACSG